VVGNVALVAAEQVVVNVVPKQHLDGVPKTKQANSAKIFRYVTGSLIEYFTVIKTSEHSQFQIESLLATVWCKALQPCRVAKQACWNLLQ